ncbi:uracil-DNA glycosylase family protein [Mucilaginibacter sp.]|uniref:uracil-DNA glycosylase family protein n=1 Tax=Mucilaginibacter sp. TaxID=1882438 RepID=UPI0035BC775B
MTFADKVIAFNKQLEYTGPPLPANIRIMNPFKEADQALTISEQFYRKYYSDDNQRHLILGINPGRFGGGLTGIPFTDPKRLIADCHIPYTGKLTHETSSAFIYEMINAYGGPHVFYRDLYINSLFPLGFTTRDEKGREKNYNYYDSKELSNAVTPAIIENIKKQIAIGCYTNTCFCFGTGQNEKFIKKLNDEHGFFNRIVALEHPRFIMQYKSKSKQAYIDKYLEAFSEAITGTG